MIGLAAAIILSLLRMIQGLCLGGQYGGAITYVAEHVEDKHRGYYTWLAADLAHAWHRAVASCDHRHTHLFRH